MGRFLLLLTLLAARPAWAAAPVVNAHREGDAIVVYATADVAVERAVAWSVLTDYDHYAEFVPDLHYSRVRGRDPRGLIVEQRGQARFFFLRQNIEATLAVAETPQRSVSSRAVAGSFREMEGRYEIEAIEHGTRIVYTGRVVPGDNLPLWLTAMALKSNVERQFGALVREMARRGEPGKAAQRPMRVASPV
jgi:ribosome-associated toxin RatA of RatAB toxin-antitoxin module